MSLSGIIIKIVGISLVIGGAFVLLSLVPAFGLATGLSVWVAIIVGIILLALGLTILSGKTIDL